MFRRTFALWAVLVCALACLPASAQNLVSNPGFETGDLTAWNLSGNTSYMSVDGAVEFVHSGSYALTAGPVTTLGYINQDLSTTVGGTYDLEFWLGVDTEGGETPNQFEVYWDGSLIYSETDSPAFPYTHYGFSGLVASEPSTELKFGFRHDPAIWLFDDVSVTAAPSAVPEGSSLAMLGVGLLPVALGLRKRLQRP